MKVEKRGNSYRVQKSINGKRHSFTFDHKPTKREIEEAVNSKRTDIKNISFETAAQIYIESKSNVLSPSTVRGYKKDVRMISEWFKEMPLPDIEQFHIQNEINDLAKNHSPKTVRNVHGLISAILRFYNPSMVIYTTLPQKAVKEPYIPSDDDIKRILAFLDGDPFYIPIILGCYGLRMSEMLALSVDDVGKDSIVINKAKVRDSTNKFVIKPFGKTDASNRIVYILPEIAELIHKQGFIYNNAENTLNRNLHAIQSQLGIEHFSYHKLRHYFASRMSTMTDDATVMALGGWSSDHVLKTVYRHSLAQEEHRRKLGANLGAFLVQS